MPFMRFPARLAASKLAGLLLLSIALLRSDAQSSRGRSNDDRTEDEKCEEQFIISLVYTVVIALGACGIFGCVNMFQTCCCSSCRTFEESICMKHARAGTWKVFLHTVDWAGDLFFLLQVRANNSGLKCRSDSNDLVDGGKSEHCLKDLFDAAITFLCFGAIILAAHMIFQCKDANKSFSERPPARPALTVVNFLFWDFPMFIMQAYFAANKRSDSCEGYTWTEALLGLSMVLSISTTIVDCWTCHARS